MSKNSEAVMKSQRRKKEFAVEQFGGKCQICGYDKCVNALTFHHLDPATKQHSPSYLIMRRSWEVAFEELKKCILVCANCHAEIHYQELDVSIVAQAQKTYDLVCHRCSNKFKSNRGASKYCGQSCWSLAKRKVRIEPTKNDLKAFIQAKTTWVAIGKHYGISDNAIRKWARKFGLI